MAGGNTTATGGIGTAQESVSDLVGFFNDLDSILAVSSGYKITFTKSSVFPTITLTVKNIVSRVSTSIARVLVTTDNVVLCTAGAGGFTVTLPTAVADTAEYVIVKVDAAVGAITIACNGAQTIEGNTTVVLNAQWAKVTLVSDGANWLML